MELRIILLVMCVLIKSSQSDSEDYQLKQVLIFSRHNIRTPWLNDLVKITPKQWPNWNEKPGYLTKRGELLEGYMGEFFAAWLHRENILPDMCPTSKLLYVYTNSEQRTRASAKAFVNKGYPSCNITVHSKNGTDPLFYPIIHNDTNIFIKTAYEDMNKKLKRINFANTYEVLQNILDFKDSESCRLKNKCDLNESYGENTVVIKVGEKPNLSGPIKIANSVVDTFLMEYFQGIPLRDVAWGKLANETQWQSLISLHDQYLNVIFNTTLIAKDLSQPLIRFITDIFFNDNNVPKVTLLVGHDANLYPLLNAMGIKPYYLAAQYEQIPIGGKIVFQKWGNIDTYDEFLKINYVYQSSDQLRNLERLSMENPPQIVSVELQDCKFNDDGLCPWEDFEKLLCSLSNHK